MAVFHSFRIGLIQMRCGPDKDENIEKASHRVRSAIEQGAEVVCLQELFATRYFSQREAVEPFDLAESIPGPSTQALAKLSKEFDVVIIVPLFERRTAGVYHNSAAILDQGEVIGLYRKMHIPDDPGYYEKFYFTPGDLGFRAFDTSKGRIGVLICWDQWYPEGARLTALRGPSVLFYPTAIGWHPEEKETEGAGQREAWQTIQRGHAIANGVYIAAPNRVGFEPSPQGDGGIEFFGSSFVSDPFGKIIAESPMDQEDILVAEIDHRHLETVRRHWPFFRDRRIDAYGAIRSRFIDDQEG